MLNPMKLKKILLIKSQYNFNGPHLDQVCYPLGLLYLASFMRKYGFEIKICYMAAERIDFDDVRKLIKEWDPDICGISAITYESRGLHKIAQISKTIKPETFVIAGGPYPSSDPENIMEDNNIDFIVIGEGEYIFKELIDALNGDGPNIPDIDGIVYRKDTETFHNPKKNYINDLDKLPYPAWDMVDIQLYCSHTRMSRFSTERYMPIFTSRGCPYNCTYCHNIFGKKFRGHSVERIINEIDILYNQYEIRDFEIYDDLFNFNFDRTKPILREIINREYKINIHLPNGLRIEFIDEELVSLLKQAGLKFISIPIETASPRIQKLVKKNLNLEKVYPVIDLFVKKKIFTQGYFMLGFPTETLEEIKTTINFALKSKLHIPAFFNVIPFKGTELYNSFPGYSSSFDRGDLNYYDLETPFSGTISPGKMKSLKIRAFLQCYLNPVRIYRIIRDAPGKKVLLKSLKLKLRHFFAQIKM